MPEGQVLEFSGVTKQFGAVTAVSGFSARVEPGRVTGFLGPNGAGKTTTLRILLGLVKATGGTATIGGAPYSALKQPLHAVGAVLEASSFHPGRTAANHLKVYAQAAGLPLTRVDETLGLVGLGDVGGRKVGGFSLGMRQRLGLAYALLGDPGVLVLDEPANGLDPEGIKWMRGFLRRLAREGRTVFVSSHLLAEVQQTVDSVLIISQGRLVFHGTLEDLTDPSEFSTVVDAPDRAALTAALTAAGAPFELLRTGLTVPGLNPVAVGQVAASAGIALSTLQRRGPALEEVFLDLVSGARVHPTGASIAGAMTPLAPVEGAGAAAGVGATAVAAGAATSATEPEAAEGGDVTPDTEPPVTPDTEPPVDPAPAGSTAATFTVASTGVIDIIALSAGDPETDAYADGLPLDADPDVEALGAIDAELSDEDDGDSADADEVFDTDAAVASGELASEGPDTEVSTEGDVLEDDSVDQDRPWAQYVKTDSDVEADAFFAAFTESDGQTTPSSETGPEPGGPPGAAASDHTAADDEGGEQR